MNDVLGVVIQKGQNYPSWTTFSVPCIWSFYSMDVRNVEKWSWLVKVFCFHVLFYSHCHQSHGPRPAGEERGTIQPTNLLISSHYAGRSNQ